MDYHALGKRIREERLRLNLTQEKLAEEVGVSVGAIISIVESRKCRNWQTSKTKDLVAVRSCGFKSHLPHTESMTLFYKFHTVSGSVGIGRRARFRFL